MKPTDTPLVKDPNVKDIFQESDSITGHALAREWLDKSRNVSYVDAGHAVIVLFGAVVSRMLQENTNESINLAEEFITSIRDKSDAVEGVLGRVIQSRVRSRRREHTQPTRPTKGVPR